MNGQANGGYPSAEANGSQQRPAKGVPIPAHDLYGKSTVFANGYGANPAPGWSQTVGKQQNGPGNIVATQLVVPCDLSDAPVSLTCYNCQEHITTQTKTGPSPLTWAACCCLFVFMCLPCCCLPFCYPPLNVTEHYCPNCNILLGKYKGWKK